MTIATNTLTIATKGEQYRRDRDAYNVFSSIMVLSHLELQPRHVCHYALQEKGYCALILNQQQASSVPARTVILFVFIIQLLLRLSFLTEPFRRASAFLP